MEDHDEARLVDLELALWRPETRYDRGFMEQVLAPGFIEFGRSGRVYDRESVLDATAHPFSASVGPMTVRSLTDEVALVTYVSAAEYGEGGTERANRSSIWRRSAAGEWLLEFHQGTPI